MLTARKVHTLMSMPEKRILLTVDTVKVGFSKLHFSSRPICLRGKNYNFIQ